MESKVKFEFSAKLWQYGGEGSWHFVSLPKDISNEIREHFQWQEEGWGRMKMVAEINEFRWETSIWFDSKMKIYLLPIKAEVRKKLKLKVEDELMVMIWV